MQVLMSAAAYGRVAVSLTALGGDLDVIVLEADGGFRRGAEPIDAAEVDPEVFWVSLDLFRTGQLPGFFQGILKGTRARWAQSFLAGLDNPAFAAMTAKGVRLTKSSAQAPPIAEYVLSHAFSLLHPIADQRAAQDARAWRYIPFREVASTQWLLVGFGSIGSEIARRLRPFGPRITVARRDLSPEPLADAVIAMSGLGEVLPRADVVVLACSLNAETRGLAGPDFFAAMKPGALLINIARGALVDESALRAGLDRNQPGHAVLDVFDTEPAPAESWLWDHPQVRVTAHCSNAGDGVVARGDALFLENLRRYLAGEPLLNEARAADVGP